jgi:hypothetical protein
MVTPPVYNFFKEVSIPILPPSPSGKDDIFLATSSSQANMPTFAYHKNNCNGKKQRRKEKRQKGSGAES